MKRNTQATGHGQSPTRDAPAGGLAQPDERDESVQGRSTIDRKTLGPRQIIQQAARDVARGLKDTDLHGTSTNVPGPRQATKPMVSSGGNRRSYADDQRASPPDPTPDHVTLPKSS